MSDSWTTVRLSDLSVHGLLGALAAGVGVVLLLFGAVSLAYPGDHSGALITGVVLAFFGGLAAYEAITPEHEASCDACGQRVRMHSGRGGVDEVVQISASGPPARVDLGPVSLVRRRQRKEFIYCSTACADLDDRPFLEIHDPHEIAAAEPEVGDAD